MKNSNRSTCPKCHAPIPDEAPGGLCPKCTLEGAATVGNATPGAPGTPPPALADIASHFPDLEIVELLGAGGMGAVYQARQPRLDRFVALKILSHDLSRDPAFVERFNREAKVLARLNHPNIVGVHDFGTAGPYCYLTMEFVDGVNLRQAMQAGRFTPTEALALVEHLCSALKFAHGEGILHRDIKPENILIDSKGRVKVADFGIAKLIGGTQQSDITLTMQGSVLGSPHYMAPEQIESPGEVDQRADIYSLGVVLYELLTGGLPLGRFALPSDKAHMDARIDRIVLRTLEKERQARFQSVDEMQTQVEEVTQGPPSAMPVQPPVSGVDGPAPKSLTSAVLTVLSFPFALVIVWMLNILSPDLGDPANNPELSPFGAACAIFTILATFGSAGSGFLLGTRALEKIRQSGGQMSGLGSAIFAIVTWPVILLGMIALMILRLSLEGSGNSPIGSLETMICTIVPLLFGALMLIRSLSRWARGVEDGDGRRHHPGLGLPVVMVVLLSLVGPTLIGLGFALLDQDRGRKTWGDPGQVRPEIAQIDWYRGGPEVTFPLEDPLLER